MANQVREYLANTFCFQMIKEETTIGYFFDFKLLKENLNEISYFITINEGMRMNDKPRIVSCNIVEVRVVKWNFNFALLS